MQRVCGGGSSEAEKEEHRSGANRGPGTHGVAKGDQPHTSHKSTEGAALIIVHVRPLALAVYNHAGKCTPGCGNGGICCGVVGHIPRETVLREGVPYSHVRAVKKKRA